MVKTCMIGVVVDQETKSAFEQLAKNHRMSVSAFVLRLAMMGLDKLVERTKQLQQVHKQIVRESAISKN